MLVAHDPLRFGQAGIDASLPDQALHLVLAGGIAGFLEVAIEHNWGATRPYRTFAEIGSGSQRPQFGICIDREGQLKPGDAEVQLSAALRLLPGMILYSACWNWGSPSRFPDRGGINAKPSTEPLA